nr:MAG TPA: hypothetical protein [Caudoviricetes sp.]
MSSHLHINAQRDQGATGGIDPLVVLVFLCAFVSEIPQR